MRIIFTLFILLFVANTGYAQTCLSYKTSGYSKNCDKQKKKAPKETPPPPPPPVIVAPPPVQPSPVVEIKIEKKLTEKEELDIKVEGEVDEFLANHGKPPREFARFMINPTLENALVWAQKYDDMLKRTEETTVAWMKAQQILKEQQAGNLNIPIPELKTKRRAVPNYDLNWDEAAGGFMPTEEEKAAVGSLSGNVSFISEGGSLIDRQETPEQAVAIDNPDMQLREVFAMLQQAQNKNAVASDRNAPVPQVGNTNSLIPNPEMTDDDKIYVSYYFSAECPYCKKFEPGFQEIITELGDKISVTCVDMTPSKKDIVNIYGKVDCDWRPLMPDEMDAFGIESTPTILVNFPGTNRVERLEGFVKVDVLRNYLKI